MSTVLKFLNTCGGEVFTDGNGFAYRINDRKHDHRWYLKCCKLMCKGRAVMNVQDTAYDLKHTTEHTCAPNTLFVEEMKLRDAILKRCESENRSIIFKEECNK